MKWIKSCESVIAHDGRIIEILCIVNQWLQTKMEVCVGYDRHWGSSIVIKSSSIPNIPSPHVATFHVWCSGGVVVLTWLHKTSQSKQAIPSYRNEDPKTVGIASEHFRWAQSWDPTGSNFRKRKHRVFIPCLVWCLFRCFFLYGARSGIQVAAKFDMLPAKVGKSELQVRVSALSKVVCAWVSLLLCASTSMWHEFWWLHSFQDVPWSLYNDHHHLNHGWRTSWWIMANVNFDVNIGVNLQLDNTGCWCLFVSLDTKKAAAMDDTS